MWFGVMFGDVFHGATLTSASWFTIKHKDKLYKNYKTKRLPIDGRYVLLLRGLSSITFGFLYSDSTSFPINIFGGRATSRNSIENIYPSGLILIGITLKTMWIFTTSVKMKISIIIGFFHLGLGVVISFWDLLYFKDKVDLFCVVIPQAFAFAAFLVYLDFLIFRKCL